MSESKRPNCYDCKWRGAVPGDAHSSCKHPDAGDSNLGNLMSMLSRGGPTPSTDGASKLNIQCHPTGRARGWFNWPFNFDPVWLENCDGFEAKQAQDATKAKP